MHQSTHTSLTTNIPRSPRVDVALAWIAAFTNWDLPAVYSFVTDAPDFAYSYLPASAGISSKTRAEWHVYNCQMKAMLPDFYVEVLNIFESSGPVIAHIVGRATSRTGAPFVQEYIMFIHIRSEIAAGAPDGDVNKDPQAGALRLYKVEEFVDSRFASDFFAAERLRWRSAAGKRSSAIAVSREADNGVVTKAVGKL